LLYPKKSDTIVEITIYLTIFKAFLPCHPYFAQVQSIIFYFLISFAPAIGRVTDNFMIWAHPAKGFHKYPSSGSVPYPA